MSGVVSVGAAVGAAALAAEGIATVGLTMGTVMSMTAAVGAAASAVGYFTKSKELQIGGAALGLVGGIGGMAAGAGMFGAASAAGDVAAVAGPAGGYTATLGAEGLGTTMGAAGGFTGSTFSAGGAGMFANVGDLISGKGLGVDVISSITGGTPPPDTLLQGSTSAALPSGNVGAPVDQFGQTIAQGGGEGGTLGVTNNPSAQSGLLNSPGPQVTPTPEAAAPSPMDYSGNPPISTGPYQSTMPSGTDIPIVTVKPGETQPASPMPAGTDASPWASILKFMKDNPSLTMGGLNAAGSFLKGAFDPKTGPEIEALNASAARNNAEASLLNRRMSNMSQPVPKATRTRTNTGTGLINRQTV